MAGMNFSFDTYADYGLSENPFLIQALRPNDIGMRLLVGRNGEIDQVAKSLHKQGKITCLDGQVGVGKTSLVNVAAYKCYRAFLSGDTNQMLLPASESFQLAKDDQDVDAFCQTVFRRVAQTLLEHREQLKELDQLPQNVAKIDAWLNSPIVEHITGAMGMTLTAGIPAVAAMGATSGTASSMQLNTGAAFNEQGFEQMVRKWLQEIFGEKGNGGIVCVIDNLELLESAANARRTLETLRDRLFSVVGLRWVFCGANGVIHSLAASARLSSFLNMPIIDVHHVDPSYLGPLFKARFTEFAMVSEQDAWERLPIRLEDLRALYLIVNYNLRDLLAQADQYCEAIHGKDIRFESDEHKEARFRKWLDGATTTSYQALKTRLPSDAFVILDLVMADEFRGTFGIGNYESLNQNSRVAVAQSTFVKRLRDLENNGLIAKTLDEEPLRRQGGFSRNVYSVTAKGALIHYARLKKHENQAIRPLTWLKRAYLV
jgi:hypothetical protein